VIRSTAQSAIAGPDDRRVVVDLRAAAEHRREDPAAGGIQVGRVRIDVRDAQMRDEASAEHVR
jgi:hypothetical protein